MPDNAAKGTVTIIGRLQLVLIEIQPIYSLASRHRRLVEALPLDPT
jgi:hypothetical protein